MVAAMDREGFGSCTNHGECEAVCPKLIPLEFIARLNRDFLGERPSGPTGIRWPSMPCRRPRNRMAGRNYPKSVGLTSR